MATYFNGDTTVFSYVSIFENLWIQTRYIGNHISKKLDPFQCITNSTKQKILKLSGCIQNEQRIHLKNRYRSGFHPTRKLRVFLYHRIEEIVDTEIGCTKVLKKVLPQQNDVRVGLRTTCYQTLSYTNTFDKY